MTTEGERLQRKAIMSAPPLCRLPRTDTWEDRQELVTLHRRTGTARIRRQYLESRQHEFEAESCKRRQLENLKKYKAYLHQLKLINEHKAQTRRPDTHTKETPWQISQCDVPERLPICVPLRVQSPKGQISINREVLSSKLPVFYKVDNPVTRTYDTKYGKLKLQHFINHEWASEKSSWSNFQKNVPTFHKLSWVC